MNWIKSSYSTNDGPSCVEVAWIKSSYSGSDNNDCVEVAATPATVLVRDSKDPMRPPPRPRPRGLGGLPRVRRALGATRVRIRASARGVPFPAAIGQGHGPCGTLFRLLG